MPACARPTFPTLSPSLEAMPRSILRCLLTGATALAFAAFAAPALAQYKIVGPDGKVTYTDRAPNSTEAQVTSLGSRSVRQAPEPELPFELRQMAAKYPVTLYVTSEACEPCSSGRQMLRQRGIPYNERVVKTAEDGEALEKLTGAREAPTLKIGSQTLRGYAAETWGAYLDAAGYPKTSSLPANYEYPAAQPLVAQRSAANTRNEPRTTTARPAATSPTAVAPPAGSIRF